MIIRHDIDPALYLVDPTQFPAVVAVDSFQEEVPIAYDNIDRMLKPSLIAESLMVPETCDRTDGMGSLIAPNWILTAAHVAAAMSLEKEVVFSDKAYSIEQIVIHPDFLDWPEETNLAENDIALIKLTRLVEGIKPLLLHQQTDELRQVATFLGSGDFGNGLIGPDSVDSRLRMATNRVVQVDTSWLMFEFDVPPEGTDLEGVAGPGDGGGPALLNVDGEWAIAGVRSGQNPKTFGEGHYGVWEYYTRVSQYASWIESVMSC